jgi:regulator of RNase E activity RraA
VLVVDNGGRLDEACVGDIVALEAQQAGIAGIVIWGLHRDASELRALGLPLFSLGGLPTGPQRLDPRPEDAFEAATVGAHRLGTGDIAVADANGVLFLPEDRLPEILEAAAGIRDTELRQLAAMRAGRSFRTQVRLPEYVARRRQDPGYGFRQHIREIQAAGEE